VKRNLFYDAFDIEYCKWITALHSRSFTKADRLLSRTSFVEVTGKGKKIQNQHFIVFYSPNQLDRSRLGITVTRKIGSATTRNRIKRISREFFRNNRLRISGNWDINLIAKKKAAYLSSDEAFSSLENLFDRL